MTPDIAAIRAALAATPSGERRYDLQVNAPTWLAQLCDEIERLRTEAVSMQKASTFAVEAHDAALAEIERLAVACRALGCAVKSGQDKAAAELAKYSSDSGWQRGS